MLMGKTRLLAGAVLCGLSVGGCEQLRALGPDPSHGAIAACEEATQKTLKSPSSYRRVWAGYDETDPLNGEDEQRYRDRGKCAARKTMGRACTAAELDGERLADAYSAKVDRDIERKKRSGAALTSDEKFFDDLNAGVANRPKLDGAAAETGFVTLEYDSANSFGAQLRAFGICRFGPIGTDGKFDQGDIFQMGPIPNELGESEKEAAARKNG